jgi:serine/threonine protein kinase
MSESIRDYMLTGDWKTSTGGMTAMAQTEGRKFFLKKYKNPVQPNTADIAAGRISKKTYEANKTRFDSFVSARSKINEFLSTKAGMGGNIILPLEWFVDANLYVEASEFVSGLISDDDIIRLPYENKKLVMLTATSALASVHKLGIVHGDLKATNILGAKNAAGNYVAKIIDFDCSYFMTEKPKNDIGGDQVYAAPELGLCWMSEMEPEYVDQLSVKSDIFSLGLVFHRYITGDLPQPKSIPKEMLDKYNRGSIFNCL